MPHAISSEGRVLAIAATAKSCRRSDTQSCQRSTGSELDGAVAALLKLNAASIAAARMALGRDDLIIPRCHKTSNLFGRV